MPDQPYLLYSLEYRGELLVYRPVQPHSSLLWIIWQVHMLDLCSDLWKDMNKLAMSVVLNQRGVLWEAHPDLWNYPGQCMWIINMLHALPLGRTILLALLTKLQPTYQRQRQANQKTRQTHQLHQQLPPSTSVCPSPGGILLPSPPPSIVLPYSLHPHRNPTGPAGVMKVTITHCLVQI